MSARLLLSILLPFMAGAAQWLLWGYIKPYVWFLFFPAAFFSAWIGGLLGGLAGTLISVVLVWFFFIPPTLSFALETPASIFSMAVFVFMGSLFAIFFERLRKAMRLSDEALVNTRRQTLDELSRSAERLRRLAEVVERIAAVRDQESLTTIVCHAVRDLIGAAGATAILRAGQQCHYVDEDALSPLWKGQYFPMESCVSGWVMLHAEAVVIEDIYVDTRVPYAAYRPTFVKSLSIVPVGREQPQGALGCYWAERHKASSEELELLQALADAMSVGLANLELLREMTHARLAAEQSATLAQESEQRFRATFEQAAVGIALVALDGHWLRVNQKLCDIVGYCLDELLEKTFQDITHPDDLDSDLAYVQRLLAGEITTYSLEKRYRRKNGAVIWVNLTVALVRHPDGCPDYFISIIEDIERRKEVEAALKASEASLKEAQRLTSVGSWTWNLETGEHLWSEEIYRIYGRDPALPPASYPEVASYFVPESWEHLAAVVETAVAQGLAYECDAQTVHPDGSHRWITARGEPTRDASGKVVELHGTVQDITARKQAEEEIRSLNADLEQRVAARTAELTVANQELDSFAYAVSHDLRAPLRAMSGFSLALLEDYGDKLQGEGEAYLKQIMIASDKMGRLIDGILSLSRSVRGELQRDELDISALATSILADLARFEPERVVSIEVAPGLQANGDGRMVSAVMENLLANAWKYTAKTPNPLIRVRAGEVNGLQGICVEDNGAGFDMAYAKRLFKPFQRLHREDEFPGIGIGLATVRRIVHRHGGEISARAALGEGACFCFSLTPAVAETESLLPQGGTDVTA